MADLFQEVARPLAVQHEIMYPDALEWVVITWFENEFVAFDQQATKSY